MEGTSQLTSWENFSKAIMLRFRPFVYDDPAAQFKRLTQSSSVKDYKAQFEFLSNRLTHLSDKYKLSYFFAGLKEELKLLVRLLNPTNTNQAFGMARLQERYSAITKRNTQIPPPNTYPNRNPNTSQIISYQSTQNSPKPTFNANRISNEKMRE